MLSERLGLYTTIYPGVEPYLARWYQSVQSQTDRNFDLWIGVDSLSKEQIIAAIGAQVNANWLMAEAGDSPAQIRQKAIERMIDECSSVVFVDSDDLLYPSRIEAAREALRDHDGTACALQIIDEKEKYLGIIFGALPGEDACALLARYNVFGLSNTAYRSDILRRCLPLSAECQLIDWLLATRAWALDASLYFDHTPRMAYRQYPANVAPVLHPFEPGQVMEATRRVLCHYNCALETEWELPEPQQQMLKSARHRVEAFQKSLASSTDVLASYVEALNRVSPRYVWWWYVAHPDLEYIWKN